MTTHEYTLVITALENSRLADLAGFKIEVWHDFDKGKSDNRGQWDIILVPTIKRIFLISDILKVVDNLDVDLAVYTDINRPGCIVFH